MMFQIMLVGCFIIFLGALAWGASRLTRIYLTKKMEKDTSMFVKGTTMVYINYTPTYTGFEENVFPPECCIMVREFESLRESLAVEYMTWDELEYHSMIYQEEVNKRLETSDGMDQFADYVKPLYVFNNEMTVRLNDECE